MAKKTRSEKNKRFSYIGTGAKYTISLNGDELNLIAGALSALISNVEKSSILTPAEFRKKQGFEKENWMLEATQQKAEKLIKDLNLFGMKGYYFK